MYGSEVYISMSSFEELYFLLQIKNKPQDGGLGLWCLMPLSVISWWSVLLVEETGVPRENHRPITSN